MVRAAFKEFDSDDNKFIDPEEFRYDETTTTPHRVWPGQQQQQAGDGAGLCVCLCVVVVRSTLKRLGFTGENRPALTDEEIDFLFATADRGEQHHHEPAAPPRTTTRTRRQGRDVMDWSVLCLSGGLLGVGVVLRRQRHDRPEGVRRPVLGAWSVRLSHGLAGRQHAAVTFFL